jgi:putative oxidoreductase
MYVDPGLAILRLVIGGIVLAHGVQKLGYLGGGGRSGTVGVMGHIGVKPESFWAAVVTAAEVGGGILIILGFLGPVGPWLIVADMLVAAITIHWPNGFWSSKGGIEFPLSVGAGALALGLVGFGTWSLDRVIGLVVPDWLVQGWTGLVILGVVLALVSRYAGAAESEGGTSTSS